MGRVDGNPWPPLSRMGDGDGRVLEERCADVNTFARSSCAVRGRGRGRDGTGGPGKLGAATQLDGQELGPTVLMRWGVVRCNES